MSELNKQDKAAAGAEKPRTRKWGLFFILFILCSGFVVYYFAEIKKEVFLINRVNVWWLLAAILAQVFTYVFTAAIYSVLLESQRERAPRLADLLRASIISLFINQTVPSAGISGNTFILHFLARYKLRLSQVLCIIISELLTSYAAMEMLIVFCLAIFLSGYHGPEIFTVTLLTGIAAYIFFGIIVSIAGRKKTQDYLSGKIRNNRFLNRLLLKQMNRFDSEGIGNEDVHLSAFLRENQGPLWKALLFHLLVIAADAATIYALFHGLGIPTSAFVVLLSLVCTRIISLLPISPGSLVVYESSMSFLFVSLGVPASAAVIVTLLFRLLSFWFPMPAGLLLYRAWLRNPPITSNN